MSKYYNTTRGPIAVALSSGKSITVPPKTWIDIDPSDAGSPSLAPMIRKGFLKRSALPDPVPEEVSPAPVSAPVTAPASAATVATAPAVEEKEKEKEVSTPAPAFKTPASASDKGPFKK
jgi:hypothetical protein